MSWEKIKQGYAAIDRLYGQSNLKANRFAYMAYLLGDKAAAREAFDFLGDHAIQRYGAMANSHS